MTTSWPPSGLYKTNQINSPAYTTVSVSTSFSLSTTPSPASPRPSSISKPQSQWPQSVREYVGRAFGASNTIPGVSNEEISAKLREVIGAAADNNMLHEIDWSQHPLPQEIICLERFGQLPSTSPSSNMSPTRMKDLPSRKRKSTDVEGVAEVGPAVPPWRQGGLAGRVESVQAGDRKDRKRKKIQEFRATAGPSKFNDLEKRKDRFGASLGSPSHHDSDTPFDAQAGPVIGTNQNLEKQYFRLTAPPKPESVRPLEVLRRTIELLTQKWKAEHSYTYICDQFKSMRQDLTVQHIKNDFTVRVYEAHARIALEMSDLGEYNQCQSQLRTLYKQKLGGHPGEFTAYRILYMIHTHNRTGMNDLLADLTSIDKRNAAVKHALEVRAALARGNYHKFFKLYEECPNMGGYLMDMFVDRERVAAMAILTRAYKPDVKVSYLTAELAFDDDQHCAQFICDHADEHLLEDREDGPRYLCGKAGNAFDLARQKAFATVDIKGQI